MPVPQERLRRFRAKRKRLKEANGNGHSNGNGADAKAKRDSDLPEKASKQKKPRLSQKPIDRISRDNAKWAGGYNLGSGDQIGTLSQLNPAEIPDGEDEPERRPIENAQQALWIYKRFEINNRKRMGRNKAIEDAYNGAEPYAQADLDAASQGWRSNFSTLFMASLIDRVTPKFVDAIHSMKYLTASQLPPEYGNSDDKTTIFRDKTTKLIREWSGWPDFVAQVAQENVKFGYTAAVFMDELNWRPRTFPQEKLFFDDNTPQFAGQCPIMCVKVDYYIHELVEILRDPEAAEDAGYEVDNIRKAINAAMPPKESFLSNPRQLSDLVREGNMYLSYHRQSRMIQTAHIFVMGYDGQGVDHWWINIRSLNISSGLSDGSADWQDTNKAPPDDENNPALLFYAEDVARSMKDVVTLVSFQTGNSKLFGSKGLGRLLVNLDVAINRCRMCFIDAIYQQGLIIAQCDEKDIPFMSPRVAYPFIWVPKTADINKASFDANADAFIALDNKLTAMSEIIAGAFIPGQITIQGGPDQTATEVNIDTQRENEIKQGILNRWWTHMTQCVGVMQRRACSIDNIRAAIEYVTARDNAQTEGMKLVTSRNFELLVAIDPNNSDSYEAAPNLGTADYDAVHYLVGLMDAGISPEEILFISQTSASDFSQDVGVLRDQALTQYAMLARGDPDIDQYKLKEMVTIAQLGPERTKELLIPQQQNTTSLEQSRAQLIEFAAMLEGEPIVVSPRDAHLIHFRALQARVFPMLNQMAQIQPAQAVPPQMMNSVVSAVQHAEAHLDMLLQSKAVKEKDIEPEIKALKQAQQMLAQIGEQAQKEQAAQAQAAQAQAANEMTQATMQMRSAGIDPAQVASRVMQAGSGGAMGMPPPQPGTGGPGGGPVPNPSPISTMAAGGAPPATPNPLTAAPQGAG
jgi:hypothetical protein